jgi:hypothetical protein
LRPDQESLAAQAVGTLVVGGALSQARSYDSVTRTVRALTESHHSI